MQDKRRTGRDRMTKQSKVAGGKAMALAGAAVAAVIVVIGLLFSARMAPQVPVVQEVTPAPDAAPAVQPEATAQTQDDDADSTLAEAETPADEVAEAEGTEEVVTEEETAAEDTLAEDTPTEETPAEETPADVTAADSETPATDAPAEEAAAEEASTDASTDTAAAAPEAAPAAQAPSFDTVRVAPDGEALIAGRGIPGRLVEVLLDGQTVTQTEIGPDGAFVAFLSLSPADQPRVLTLRIPADGGAAGDTILSTQQVIIAPVAAPLAAPVTIAEAAPEAATDTPAEAASEETTLTDTPAPAAPALLLADGDGLRVLQPATPANPAATDGIALDMISYTADGDVLLQGRATPDQTVLAYLDNRPVTSAAVGADGIWTTGLPGVRPGIYTLRLDEVDATGRVLSRIETPFKREDRAEVAAIAAATAPAPMPEPGTEAGAEAAQPAPAAADATAGDATPPAATEATPAVRVVTVQPGNTLWAIARESYGAGPLFVRVFEANRDRIRDPDLIYPGQIFEIPD